MNKKNSLAVLALILTTSCASAQYTEFPYDIRMGTNADIFLNDNTNALGDRLAALSNQIVSGVTSVTNPAIVLTDGSRAMLLLNALNTNSLGSELLANNDFSGSADNWALTNCAYSANGITITGATTATITFTNTLALGAYKSCQIGLDITGTGPVASLTFAFAGKTGTVSSISTGVYRFAVTAELTNGLRWTIVTTNGLTIDNATVKIITDGDGTFADQITAGGDVRVGGQLRGATNIATMAQMAAEETARIAADSNLTAAVALETTNRVTADTAINAELDAIADTYVNVAGDTQTGALTNTVSITTTNIQSTTQTVALVIQGRDAQVAAVVGSDVIVRGGKAGGTGVGDGGDVYILGGECTNPGDEAGTGGNVYLTAYPGTSTGGCVFIRSGISATPPNRAYPIVFMVGTNLLAHFRQGYFDVVGGDLLSRGMYVPRLVGTYTNKNPSTVSTNNLLNGDYYLDAGSNTIVRFLNNTWKWSTLNGF